MKIALAQISPHLGDVKKNFELHLEMIEKAKKRRVNLLVFPELSLTGYALKDLVEEVALNPEKNPLFKELKTLSRDISLVFGFVEEKETEKGLFYNSAAYLSGGKVLHIHRKVFLPTYGMFEEGKFYAPGKNFKTFLTSFGKTGLMICRDFLSFGASYLLFAGGSEIIIVLSAAPGRGVSEAERFTTSHMWELMGEAVSYFSTAFVIYCNRVGFEEGMPFAGGSFIYSPSGQLLIKGSYVDPDFILKEVSFDDLRTTRKKWPFKRDDKPEVLLESLKRIVQKYED